MNNILKCMVMIVVTFLPHVSCEALTLTNDNIWGDEHIDNINSGYMNIDLDPDERNLLQSIIMRGSDKRNHSISEVRISGNTAIFNLSSNVVMAYSLSDKKILWQTKLNCVYDVWVDRELVYVKALITDKESNIISVLHVLDIATGKVKYDIEITEAQQPIFDDRKLYLLNQYSSDGYEIDTSVLVYEKRTGKKTANLNFKNKHLSYREIKNQIIRDKKLYFMNSNYDLVELDLLKIKSRIIEHPRLCIECENVMDNFLLVGDSAYMLSYDRNSNKYKLIQYNLEQQSSQVLYSANYPLYQLLTDGDKLVALSNDNLVEYDMAAKRVQERNSDDIFSDLDKDGAVFLTKNAIIAFTDSAMFKVIDRKSLSLLGYIGRYTSMTAIVAFTKNWLIYIKNGSEGGGPTYLYLYDQSHNNMTLHNQSEEVEK